MGTVYIILNYIKREREISAHAHSHTPVAPEASGHRTGGGGGRRGGGSGGQGGGGGKDPLQLEEHVHHS